MKRQLFVRKGVSILSMIGLLCVSLFTFCAKENPTTPEKVTPTYSFSGFIIDGNTGKALGGAMVTYFEADGDSVVLKTGSDGGFDIPGIPYGNRSFFFKYTPVGATAIQYTTAAITIEGNDWEHFAYNGIVAGVADSVSVVSGIRSVAGPVKLYPLSGSLSGTVITQLHDRAALNPIKNAVVKVTFDPTFNLDNQHDSTAAIGSTIEVGPSAFEALTDSTGKFTLTGLPVSGDGNEKVTVKVVSITSGGIDWATNGMDVELAANQLVPVGAVILNPMVKIELKPLDNNFKTGVVNPEHTFEVTYSDDLDTVSYAVLSYTDNVGVKRNVPATVTIAGKKITVNPVTSLINETVYTLNVYAYGKTGQSSPDVFTVTAAGGGLADVVASNVLTATKAPVFNFGVKTPVTFTFADSITGNPSVQISTNDIIPVNIDALVTTSVDGKTMTITPRSIWKSGTINVNVVLKNGTTVRFSTALNVENALAFVSSNVWDFNGDPQAAKNGLSLNSDIIYFTNKDLTTADVILKEGATTIPATVSLGEGDLKKVVIEPINTLKPATQYTVTITVSNAQGESKSNAATFTTTAAQFYSVSDNVRLGNDPTMPRLDFAPNANMVIRMNRKVVSATAKLVKNSAPSVFLNVKTVISNDSIIIDPEDILTEGVEYNLDVNAVDSFGQVIAGPFVTKLVPRTLVNIIASNVITADGTPDSNAVKTISPWFKLSAVPVAAKVRVTIEVKQGLTTHSVDAVVSVLGDTLLVDPVSDFAYDDSVAVKVTGEAIDGTYIGFTRTFKIMKKPVVSLVASNVVNSNYEGLKNIAENVEMWYKISRTPNAATITATVNVGPAPGVDENAVVRVSADTIFVKFTRNFANGAEPIVKISGLDSAGLAFTLNGDNTAWPNFGKFKVRPALFPIASNTWDVNGEPIKNFGFYDTMWVKYSQPLSTDLSVITWLAPAAGVYVHADLVSPNAKAWVNGDTLFVLPDNRAAITWGDKVGFNVQVKNTLDQISAAKDFTVEMAPLNLYVKATNTLRADGAVRTDVGFKEELFVVSSVKIDSIKNVSAGTAGVAPPDGAAGLLMSSVRLSATKDTIFYTPKVQFVADAHNSIDFDVYVGGKSTADVDKLQIEWFVKGGILISSANVMENTTTYRAFKIANDSLVVKFNKAINYASVANPFTVIGFVPSTTTWSADSTTVTLKPISELPAETWANVPNYYNVDYAIANNKGYHVKFSGIAADGQTFGNLVGPNRYVTEVRAIPEMGLALLSTNLLDSTNNPTFTLPLANAEDVRNSAVDDSLFPISESISLTFSRAIDTAKVKLNPNEYIKLWELLAGADVQNEIALSFSNAGKTIVVDPKVDLKYNTQYYVQIDTLPALIANAKNVKFTAAVVAAGNYDYKHLFNDAFKTVSATVANISAMKVLDLAIDSAVTTGAQKNYGYSPAGGYNGPSYKGVNALTVKFTELAWFTNHDDSITAYEVQVKKMGVGADTTGWYTSTATILGEPFSLFDATKKNRTNQLINLSAQAFYNDLKTDEKKPYADYSNNPALLNYGDSLAVRIRPIRDDGKDVGEFGQWSNIVYFKDNVAPLDTMMTFVANYNNASLGGVSISTANTASPVDGVMRGVRDAVSTGSNAIGFAPDFTNGNANVSNSYSVIEVTFPEDMDISATNKPTLSIVYGAGTVPTGVSAIALNETYSKWVSSRVYRIVHTIPAVDYSGNDVYCVLNVAGMKDASGIAIQSSGNTGAGLTGAANGHAAAAVDAVKGSTNLFFSGILEVGRIW